MAGFKLFTTPDDDDDDKKIPPRPPWRSDFCVHLGALYTIPHKSFQVAFPPHCNDLSDWLNQYSLTPDSPVPTADSIIAQTPAATGSGKQINVTKEEVKLDNQQQLTLTAALEMALLAKSNPEMAAQGVELGGTEEEQFILFMAAQIMKLDVKNPPTQIPPALGQNIQNDMQQTMQEYVQKMNDGGQGLNKQRLQDVFDIAINNAPSHDVKDILGNVDENTYKQAKEQVWLDQAVSISKLKKEFKIGADKAKNIRDAMVEEEFIFWPKAAGTQQYEVSVDKKGRWVMD